MVEKALERAAPGQEGMVVVVVVVEEEEEEEGEEQQQQLHLRPDRERDPS